MLLAHQLSYIYDLLPFGALEYTRPTQNSVRDKVGMAGQKIPPRVVHFVPTPGIVRSLFAVLSLLFFETASAQSTVLSVADASQMPEIESLTLAQIGSRRVYRNMRRPKMTFYRNPPFTIEFTLEKVTPERFFHTMKGIDLLTLSKRRFPFEKFRGRHTSMTMTIQSTKRSNQKLVLVPKTSNYEMGLTFLQVRLYPHATLSSENICIGTNSQRANFVFHLCPSPHSLA